MNGYRYPTEREIENAELTGKINPDRTLAFCVYCKNEIVSYGDVVILTDGVMRAAHESCAKLMQEAR